MSREEGMFMFRQEDIDQRGEGCIEMKETKCIIRRTRMRSSTRVNDRHGNAGSFNRGGSVGGRLQGGQRGGRR